MKVVQDDLWLSNVLDNIHPGYHVHIILLWPFKTVTAQVLSANKLHLYQITLTINYLTNEIF